MCLLTAPLSTIAFVNGVLSCILKTYFHQYFHTVKAETNKTARKKNSTSLFVVLYIS